MARPRLTVVHGFGLLPTRTTSWWGAILSGVLLLLLLLSLLSWLQSKPVSEDDLSSVSIPSAHTWPPQRIACLDWHQQPFTLTVPVSPEKARDIADMIERGMDPPYNPTCTVTGQD